jgi:hypothetical protein
LRAFLQNNGISRCAACTEGKPKSGSHGKDGHKDRDDQSDTDRGEERRSPADSEAANAV